MKHLVSIVLGTWMCAYLFGKSFVNELIEYLFLLQTATARVH